MSENKAYKLDFEAEPPKTKRKGRGKPEYKDTIDAFVRSGKEYAKIEVPESEKLSNVQLGLRSAIKRMGKAEEVKPITRKKELYLVTRAYSDKQKWKWKIIRKR